MKKITISDLTVNDNFLIVKQIKVAKKTASGLINPDSYENDKSSMGKVVGVGKNVDIPINAVVFFNKYSFTLIEFYRNEEYISLHIEDVIAWHKWTT